MATKPLNPFADARGEHREEVHHRTRGVDAAGARVPLLVVNLSPGGMMIRTDAPLAADDLLDVDLPLVGRSRITVRWALGGRMGCQLVERIPAHLYHSVLAGMR